MSKIQLAPPNYRRDKILVLFSCLQKALAENRCDYENKVSDIYEVASQYSRTLKKSDFDLIKNMTIDEIVEELK